ncbi:MAG: hypothetical protein IJQ82_12040 [Selenomonadaceae bacterium]|nr:hypothetical protein [Selenomonadaceae bacterium]
MTAKAKRRRLLRLRNPDFEEYIAVNEFKTAIGSFSDISLIVAVNLSGGYYNVHTLHEFINFAELHETICRVWEIVSDAVDLPHFECVETTLLLPILREVIRRNATTS